MALAAGASAAIIISTLTLTTLCSGAPYDNRTTLQLGALISQQPREGFDYSGFRPALSLALETVNNDSSLRYKFNVTINNSLVGSCMALSVSMANTIVYAV